MATHYVSKQDMARIGASYDGPWDCLYVYEPQGVVFRNKLLGIATLLVSLVQIGPSSSRK
ncbi:MAG TPA: hypothetical protein VI431_16070 [Candidatus Acidoferrum sp.]